MKKETIYSSYKLMKHLDSLLKWKETGNTFPHAIDFTLTNKCNNKCPLCFDTGIGADNTTLNLDLAKNIILQFKEVGIKTIVLGGGGDPICHPNLAEILRFINDNNIECAISTNGYGMSDDLIDAIVNCCSFMRISLDADGPDIYKKTHGMGEEVFKEVVDNVRKLVLAKKQNKSEILIGICYLVGPHTIKGVYNATKLAKELSVDNIRIRPFYNWGNMQKPQDEELDSIMEELKRCVQLSDENFLVSATTNRFELLSEKKACETYKECNVHHFYTVVSPNAKVYPCYVLKNKEEFCYGDLSKQSFKEIWASEQRKKAYERINLKDCQKHCRFEKINEFLYGIKTNQILGDMNIGEILASVRDPIYHPNFM
ncbi:MAG: radical SAM protein [archaeon]